MATISSSSSGSTYLSGTISGLDTAALVEAAVASRLTKATRLDDTISNNSVKIAAYGNVQTYSKSVLDALTKLKSGTATSAVDAKLATTTSSTSTSADSIFTPTADTTAKAGTYRVVVQQLAQTMSATGTAQSSASNALGYTGSFDIALDGMGTTTINITATMSLNDIATAINAATGSSGVEADVLQTGNGAALVLTGTETAKNFTISNITGDDVMAGLGLLAGDGSFANITQQAQRARLTFNGATVESDTNTVENILSGLTLELSNAAPETTVTLTIGNNTTGVKEALQEFVEAYNTLRSYLDQNQSVTDGAASSSAYLYGESLMRSMNQTLARILPLSYGDGDYNSLGSFGITLNTDNHLEIDETALDAALGNHFSEVVDFLANGSGFADTMYDMLNGYAGDNGTIADRVSQLQTENSDLTSRSDTIKEAANAYETMLIERYSKMEVQIQTANIIKRQIEALLNGSNDND